MLDNLFREWEDKYGVEVKDTDYSMRFRTIIRTAHEKTGKGYALKYSADARRLFRIGVNFPSESRRIEGWKIE